MKWYSIPKDVKYLPCPRCAEKGNEGSGHVTELGGLSCWRCGYVKPEEMEAYLLSPQEREKKAACSICNIASALRACGDCAFKEYRHQHETIEFMDDWAADPEWVKCLDDSDLGESPTETRSQVLP